MQMNPYAYAAKGKMNPYDTKGTKGNYMVNPYAAKSSGDWN